MNPLLANRLHPTLRRYRLVLLWRRLAIGWAGLALIGFGVLLACRYAQWGLPFNRWILGTLAAGIIGAIALRHYRKPTSPRLIAQEVERKFPDLEGLLLTAVQQDSAAFHTGFLQQQLLFDAVKHSRNHSWIDSVAASRLWLSRVGHFVCLGLFVGLVAAWAPYSGDKAGRLLGRNGLEITPGDITVERGSSVVVLARFGGLPPSAVELVTESANQETRRIPMVRSLADPIYGETLTEVTQDFRYHIEYSGQRSRDFSVAVFEHPRLERADATLTFPGYTHLEPKRIEDTRRVSAVEGTRLDLALQLNKPVSSARLVSRDTNQTVVPLAVDPQRPVANLNQFALLASGTYELQLLDANQRTNKLPVQFVFEVLKNRPPEIKMTAPRGDLRPSALEEIAFEGTVWDDFGVEAYGIAFTTADQETRSIELGKSAPAQQHRPFQHLLRLEDLGMQPDQVLSWHLWADDLGPDSQVRRTVGDLFFAEVRPFDEIYRESAGGSESPEQNSAEGNQSSDPGITRLADLQKQILTATWKLQRTGPANPVQYGTDIAVVRDAQAQALSQAERQQTRAQDLRAQTQWTVVAKDMRQALSHLKDAAESPSPLPKAVAAEQSAYQALLSLAGREHDVARARNRGQGQSSPQARQQRQIDQLDLKQSENRYETQSQARAPQSAERREELQTLQRLQELARRQQDLNDRFRELQSALAQARSEAEREEIRRRLKRLQEEEQQMLADMDELRQRLDRPENQSRLNEQRQQLDQTRRDVQQAAQAAGQGSPAQALAAGSRAQRQFEEMRDRMRQQSASQFADDMRQMRSDARETARRQNQIDEKLSEMASSQNRKLSDTDEQQSLVKDLDQQKERMRQLIDQATQISQQAENSENLLSRQLYDTLRQFDQNDVKPVQELQEELLRRGLMTRRLYERLQENEQQSRARTVGATAEMLRQGYLPQASQTSQKARDAVDDFKRGIERAAESVLGDETEALRLAQQELDNLVDQVQREANAGRAQANARSASTNRSLSGRQANAASTNIASSRPASTNVASQVASARPDSTNKPSTQSASTSRAGGEQANATRPPNNDNQNSPQASDQPSDQNPNQAGNRRSGRGQGEPIAQAGDNNESNRRTPASQPRTLQSARQYGGANPQRPVDPVGEWLDNNAQVNPGPITGADFAPWSDRLRDVEELLDEPDWRQEVASARERARELRIDYSRDRKKPDWAVVNLEVIKPLVEVRDRIADELSRRETQDPLMPIDRDPVPSRFSELVRRYYEELGRDR